MAMKVLAANKAHVFCDSKDYLKWIPRRLLDHLGPRSTHAPVVTASQQTELLRRGRAVGRRGRGVTVARRFSDVPRSAAEIWQFPANGDRPN